MVSQAKLVSDFKVKKDKNAPSQVGQRLLDLAPDGISYACGDGTARTKIIYPLDDASGQKQYPIVLFHRGSNGYPGRGYDKWRQSVAKQSLIVLIPNTVKGYADDGDEEMACKHDEDLLRVLQWAFAHPDHLGASPDFSRIGCMGHSAGAHHLSRFITRAKEHKINVKAAVFSHGGDDVETDKTRLCQTACMFLTSKGDTRERTHWQRSLDWYKYVKPRFKVYVNAKSGGHGEPHEDYAFAAWTGRFLACHLYPEGSQRAAETCPRIYDESDRRALAKDGDLATNGFKKYGDIQRDDAGKFVRLVSGPYPPECRQYTYTPQTRQSPAV